MKTCVLAAMMLAAAPAMASAVTLDELKSDGTATIAIGNEPPFTAIDSSGNVSGAAPDVARAVFQRLGVENLDAQVIDYGAMIPSLQARRVDAIAAGLFMKPDRCAAVAYSQPVLCDAEALLIPAGNPKGFQSYEDFANDETARLGAPGGGTEERLALDAGVPRDRLVVVPDPQSGLTMLQQGRIDAYSLPVLSLNDLLVKSGDSSLEVFAPVQGAPVYCDGVAFHSGDTELRDAFDVELAALKESGEFAQIIEPYGFSAEAAISTDRDTLCAQE
ncbi:ectoine/hydroxyectoine ABC transporter substrate-binding protein EhuB [Paracoccus sp. Z118]|uniref:ectoine/hydroxyectoine ABC transporter substrate-binding protein EhuB n=1 Tax=Paracoccus sp. Z118 TaxID=2851017 RepID=UPI001C2C776C|nr:ectoine/hydroxyectoine ABC transporter substrate-binding protein EhuB [Paracoccus sp. Z118]MBV0890360.1 ectoine/hydroxyectoine ABC transporter substrate-binding protein EhuB [Paracoccus sp. Z118]